MTALTARRERRRLKTIKGQAGFTLIDMLFVVALVGLLASLAIPGLMKARGAAQSASARPVVTRPRAASAPSQTVITYNGAEKTVTEF